MSGGGVVAPYSPFNNNGYLIENLNSTQTNHLQRVAKQFSELGNKMGPNEVHVKYSIGMATERYKNTSKPKEDQLSTSTDDSNSSGSFKNGPDQTQTTVDIKSDEAIPDHHARRPMNAFLIFCKRHRGIVRERYPNLENRYDFVLFHTESVCHLQFWNLFLLILQGYYEDTWWLVG